MVDGSRGKFRNCAAAVGNAAACGFFAGRKSLAVRRIDSVYGGR
jgi:hypothetical protein